MKRVPSHGLQIAPILHDFIEREALAGHRGFARRRSGADLPGLIRDFRAAQSGSAGGSGRAPSGRSTRIIAARAGQPLDAAPVTRPSCGRSAISGRSPTRFRSRRARSTTRSRTSPARSWWCPRPMRAMPSTPPMPAGAASTTRSTAPTPSRKTAARARSGGYNKLRGAAGGRAGTSEFLDQAAPLAAGSHADVVVLRGEEWLAQRQAAQRQRRRPSRNPTQFAGYRGDVRKPVGDPPAAQPAPHRDQDRSAEPDRRGRPGRRRRPRSSNRRSPPSWTWKTASRPWTRRTRSWSTAPGSA